MSVEVHRTFERQCLQAHNRFRAAHGCPPLILCEKLTDEANAWAEELSEADNLRHTPNACVGENIYVTRAKRITGDVPVNFWYDEIRHYNFDVPKHYFKAIHFTQMIWKNTRRLGVGFAKKGRATIVVVNYDPPGNVLGDFRRNVLPDMYYPDSETADKPQAIHKVPSRRGGKCRNTEDDKGIEEGKSGLNIHNRDSTKDTTETEEAGRSGATRKSRKTADTKKTDEDGKTKEPETPVNTDNREKSKDETETNKQAGRIGTPVKSADTKNTGEGGKTKDAEIQVRIGRRKRSKDKNKNKQAGRIGKTGKSEKSTDIKKTKDAEIQVIFDNREEVKDESEFEEQCEGNSKETAVPAKLGTAEFDDTSESEYQEEDDEEGEDENKGSRFFTPFNALLLLSLLIGVGAIAFIYSNKSK